MEQPPFIKHLPFIFKISTSLDSRTKRFNQYIFFFKSFLLGFFILSTISCTFESVGSKELTVMKIHDLITLTIFFSTDTFVFINKTKVCALVELITEPIKSCKENKVHSKIVEDHNKEVNLYCMVFTTFYAVGTLLWNVFSLVQIFWNFTSNNTDVKCVNVTAGWVWNSEYHLYLILLNSVFLQMSIFSCLIWWVVMLCMVIRIKYKARLLCASLNDVNGFVIQSEECLISNSSGDLEQAKPNTSVKIPLQDGARRLKTIAGQFTSFTDGFVSQSERYMISNGSSVLEQVKPNTSVKIYHRDAATNSQTIDVQIQRSMRERRIKHQIAVYFKDLVSQHLSIMEHLRMTDQNFRHIIMLCVQLGLLTLALAVPKISSNLSFMKSEYTHRAFEICLTLGGLGNFSYQGQILLDESEKLRQALYNCDWTDKHYSLRRGLLIMQTVATKPLKLTLGGVYTLSMENFTNLLRAVHSYISLFQTFQFNQH